MHQHGHSHATEKGSPTITLFRIAVAAVVVGLLIAYGMYFEVSEGQSAVVTRFGRPVDEVTDAGPHWKLPAPIDRVHFIDMRMRLFNTPFSGTFTKDKKNINLLSYVVWRVEQPLLFLQSLGTREEAEKKLDSMVTGEKNYQFGNYELTSLLSIDPSQIQTDKIEKAILDHVRTEASQKYGIAIEQVGFKRIAFPEANLEEVLKQMRAERKAEAGRIRAMGEQEAAKIRNEALVQSKEIEEQGRKEAGDIRGNAEKEAAGIYAQAQQLDPDFYRFWRSLQALQKTLGERSTVILRNDQGFFDVLSNPPMPAPASPAPAAPPAKETQP